MSNSFTLNEHHETVSEPGDSPTRFLRTPPSFSPYYRRRSYTPQQNSPLRRTQSLQALSSHCPTSTFDVCRTETRRLTSWSEYTVRRTLVRFRNRKTVSRHPLRRLSGQRRVPAQTIKEALDHEYEVCKSEETRLGERLIAVFMCWFYGWIMDLYYNLTAQGTERSFIKWVLATLLVTSGALIVIGLTCFALHQVNFLIFLMLNAGVDYLSMLMGFLVFILSALAILNFD